jgi:hypothetical protein
VVSRNDVIYKREGVYSNVDRATAATYVELQSTECKSIRSSQPSFLSFCTEESLPTPLRPGRHRRENQRDLQRERVTPGVSWSRGSHGIGALGRTDGCMSEVYVSESGHARGAGSRGPGVRAVNSHFLWYQYVGVPASATSGAACEGCLGLKVRNQVRLRV